MNWPVINKIADFHNLTVNKSVLYSCTNKQTKNHNDFDKFGSIMKRSKPRIALTM